MLKLRKIAVTGGLSCGKSSVCRFFEKFGAYVVNADDIVHRLLSQETDLGQSIIQLIGNDIIVDNQIDRSKIAEKVFNQPSLLRSLEQLIHPKVLMEIKKQYELANRQKQKTLFVAEVPLLFEVGMEDFFDGVIVVVADPKISQERFQKSKKYGPEEYVKRSQQQLPIKDKIEKADYILVNNGSLQELEAKTEILMKQLMKESHS